MAGPGVISFTRTEKYSSHVAEELKEIRDTRVFSDFNICIKDQTIPCHRLVLSVHSAMLKAMLLSGMAEAAKHSVKLDHIDLGIMQVILDYMYIGQISFQAEQLSDMIIACDYLRINMLKDMCVEHVASILQPENAVLWLKLSHKLDLVEVKSSCLEIIGSSFTTIYRQPEFVDLSLVSFQECLEHVQTTEHKQDVILDAALNWVERDTTERLEHLETLVEQVQLDLCSLQGIVEVMKKYKTMINSTETLYDRLISAVENISCSLSPKAKTRTKPTILIIGGQKDQEVSRVVWKWNGDKGAEEMLKVPFDDLQIRHSVCKTPDGFIISGGEHSTLCVMYNVRIKKWSRLKDMMSRYCHGSISIKGVLYVLGGYVDEEASKSVHSLVIEGGSWQKESDFPISLIFPKVAEIGEHVFLLDQQNGQLFQMDIVMDQKEWSLKAPLPTGEYRGVSMTTLNGKLYVAGERVLAWYTPATDTWVQGQSPQKEHIYGSLVPYNAKLLLLGGSGDYDTYEEEEFDIEHNTWSVSTWKLPAPLWGHHALVLDIPEEA